MKRTLCLSSVFALSALVLGCGFESEPEPAAGGEVRFISGSAIKTLDPQVTSWLVDFRIIEGLFEPLLRVNPETLELEPSAAAALPKVSDDGLIYTFTIREDARWSNGDPLLASDFAYGWMRALLPDLAADYAALFFTIEGAEDFYSWRTQRLADFQNLGISADEFWAQTRQRFADTVGIEPIDDRTLRVTLAQPTAYFNELVAFAPFSPVHEATADAYLEAEATAGGLNMDPVYFQRPDLLVSNGPYLLKQWRFKQQLVLDQNPYWWNRAEMGNTRVVMQVVTDPTAALLRYNRGEADWYPGLPTGSRDAAKLVQSDRPDVHYGPAAGTYFYVFNCRPTVDGQANPFADPRVRRAFSMAVDRQTLVDNVTQLGQPVAKTFVPPAAIPGYDAPVDAGVSFDPEAARQLLADAGYPSGQGLSGLTLLINEGGGHEDPAQFIRKAWETHLGVSVQIESVERITFSDRLKTGGFQVARAGWFGDYRDPTTFHDKFRSNNNNNDGLYQNPAYDRLLERAEAELDPAARMALLAEAEALMLAEQPLMPLYHYTNLELFDPGRVTGLHPNPWNIRRLDAITVRPAPGSSLGNAPNSE
ncbi:MAG: peptide ABC transporter substrate-binding protein [Planctomycetota bacterium]